MANKRRKPGQWREVVAGRSKIERDLRHGQGLSNVPKLSETGSAAYRRLKAKEGKRGAFSRL